LRKRLKKIIYILEYKRI